MLMITEEKILKLEDAGSRFKYLLKGKYIEDCIKNTNNWNCLTKDFLEVDMLSIMEEENKHEQDIKHSIKKKELSTVTEEKFKTPKQDELSSSDTMLSDQPFEAPELFMLKKISSESGNRSSKNLNKIHSHEVNFRGTRDTFTMNLEDQIERLEDT